MQKCPYYALLYMQSILIIHCMICKVFLLFTALYAKCSYYSLLHMQSVLIIYCFICKAGGSDHDNDHYHTSDDSDSDDADGGSARRNPVRTPHAGGFLMIIKSGALCLRSARTQDEIVLRNQIRTQIRGL